MLGNASRDSGLSQSSETQSSSSPKKDAETHSAGSQTAHGAGTDPMGAMKNREDEPNYLDWASSYLMDGNANLLGNFDFNNSNMSGNQIMQKIQFQSSVHDPDKALSPSQHNQHSQNQHNQNQHQQNQHQQNQHQQISQMNQQMSQINPSISQMNQPQLNQPQLNQVNQVNSLSHQTGPDFKQSTPTSQPPSAKSRRPCDHCRRRKTKCVIIPGTNNCAQCEAKSITCTYSSTPTHKDESVAKRARRNESDEIVPPNVPIRNVAPVQDYSMMNNSLLKKTLSLQFPRSSFYVGPTSYLLDTNLLEVIIGSQSAAKNKTTGAGRAPTLNKIEQINLSDAISLRKVDQKTQFVLKDDQSRSSFQNMSNDVDAVEKFVAPHGQILIDLYFRIIHPSYPILHKKVFLEKYSRTHREFSAPLLAAVYVLAIQWWDYDPQLNRFPKPNVEQILRIALRNYILEILKRPKLSAVQAGLLLLQCKHILRDISVSSTASNSNDHASASLTSSFNDADYNDWVLCSQVVALSEELGLGLDCDTWKLPKWERGLRKRLAWAVYLEDKWLSLKNSRPSHINELNWVVSDLAEEDFPEKHGDGDLKEGSSDITNGKKIFMSLIELSQIVSEILNTLFSMRAMKTVTDINEVLRIAKPIQLKLRTWYHSLPPELQMNSVQPRKLCSNGYLQLAYFAAELTLHRKIITTLYQQSINGTQVPEELVNVCRSAAKTRLIAAMEFVRELKPEHIHSFWHSSSSANFSLIGTFAALLFVSSNSKEEAAFFKEHIFNYRWILKISAKGFLQVSDTLTKMDLVLSQIPGLLNDNMEQPMMTPNVQTGEYNKMFTQSSSQMSSPHVQRPQQSQPQMAKNSPLSQHSPHSPMSTGQTNMSYEQRPYAQQQHSNSNFNSNSSFMSQQGVSDSTRPSTAQQFRVARQGVESPYGSQQSFQSQSYVSPQETNKSATQSISHASAVPSPQENGRSQNTPGSVRNGYDRTPSQLSDGRSSNASAKTSPSVVKSPLALQQPFSASQVQDD